VKPIYHVETRGWTISEALFGPGNCLCIPQRLVNFVANAPAEGVAAGEYGAKSVLHAQRGEAGQAVLSGLEAIKSEADAAGGFLTVGSLVPGGTPAAPVETPAAPMETPPALVETPVAPKPLGGVPLPNEQIIVFGSTPKPGSFLLRPGVDTKSIGSVITPGKSASIATTLDLPGEFAQMFGPEREMVRGDTLSGAFVEDVRAAGFDVVTAPTKTNPLHVRIIAGERTFDKEGTEWLSLAFDLLQRWKKR
jgi:hypothetical protein